MKLHRLLALLLVIALALPAAGCGEARREDACFALFEVITENLAIAEHSRLTVDLSPLPLTADEEAALRERFERFARKKDIYVFYLTLSEAREQGYVKRASENGELVFRNGFHFAFGSFEQGEDGALTFDLTYAWRSTRDAFGADNAVVAPHGGSWRLEEYDRWTGMVEE